MSWRILIGSGVAKFLERERLPDSAVREVVSVALRKFEGENVSVDIRKLKGEWAGFNRIRLGEKRLIVEFDFDRKVVLVERFDWRGRAYRR